MPFLRLLLAGLLALQFLALPARAAVLYQSGLFSFTVPGAMVDALPRGTFYYDGVHTNDYFMSSYRLSNVTANYSGSYCLQGLITDSRPCQGWGAPIVGGVYVMGTDGGHKFNMRIPNFSVVFSAFARFDAQMNVVDSYFYDTEYVHRLTSVCRDYTETPDCYQQSLAPWVKRVVPQVPLPAAGLLLAPALAGLALAGRRRRRAG